MKPSSSNTVRLFRPYSLAAPLAAISLATTIASQAALVVSRAEDSDAYVTTVGGLVSVYDFNSLNASSSNPGSLNQSITWTDANPAIGNNGTVGTIDQVYGLLPFDGTSGYPPGMYGGASVNNETGTGKTGTIYASQSGTFNTTLTLSEPMAYFGMWWSAGDAYNRLTFYNGTTLVAEFHTSTLRNAMPNSGTTAAYYGNPRLAIYNNPSEIYAFINYFGQDGTTWNKIEFTNDSSNSNFESDNWTVREQAWGSGPEGPGKPLPGIKVASVTGTVTTPIPEPSTLLAALASVGFFVLRRKR